MTNVEDQGKGMLFTVGTGRCGSTPVYEMLARHPESRFISNVDTYFAMANLKGRWNRLLYDRMPRWLTQRERVGTGFIRQTRLHYGPSEAWELLGRQVSPQLLAPFRDLTGDDVTPWLERQFRAFFAERIRVQGGSLFLHHFTGWPRVGFVHAIFPKAKFVHVIRDGRAVANSFIQQSWWRGHFGPPGWRFGPLPQRYEEIWDSSGRSLVLLAGLEWMLLMDAFEVARAPLHKDLWMDLRYEDFVEDPRGQLRRILDHVGLPWTPEFESRLTTYSLGTSRTAGYLKELTGDQVRLLDRVMGEHLRRYGYVTPAVESVIEGG